MTRVAAIGLGLGLSIGFVPPALAQSATYRMGSGSYDTGSTTFSSPPPVVYGQGMNSFGGGVGGQILQKGVPILRSFLGGGGIGGAMPGALSLAESYLPESLQSYAGLLTPVLQSALGGGAVNLGGLLSSGLPILGEQLGLSSQTTGIIGSLTPLASDLLSGNFSVGSAINAGLGIAGQFLGNNPVFGVASGVLGGLFGGGGQKGTGVDVAADLSQLYSNPITAAINSQIFSGSESGDSSTVISQTGTILCLYNSDCVQSNPEAYRQMYKSASGVLGFSSPNQVRGQIAQFSEHGVMPDMFSTKNNPQQNAYYMGNLADREISRGTTEAYLSPVGQLNQKKSIQAGKQTAQKLAALGDSCDKKGESTQDLVRCDMKINTATPSYLAAQYELMVGDQVDRQFMKNSLGNISSSTDSLSRVQDVERSSWNAMLQQNLALSAPLQKSK